MLKSRSRPDLKAPSQFLQWAGSGRGEMRGRQRNCYTGCNMTGSLTTIAIIGGFVLCIATALILAFKSNSGTRDKQA